MIKNLRHPRTLLVVLLLPLLVTGIGMWALTGRVDRISEVPAAVVNLDEGAKMTVDGKEQFVPFGRMLAGALTQPGTVTEPGAPKETGFDWRLTDAADAKAGLRDGSYSAIVTIPENFSGDLATLGQRNARQARIEVTTNDATGQLDALVGAAVAEVSANAMGQKLTDQYLDGIYLGFNDMKESFGKAADGADDLADGAHGLDDGITRTDGGAHDLADGARRSAQGSHDLADGAGQLASGAGAAADGQHQLARGLSDLSTGADDLAGGTRELANGSGKLADGAETSAAGSRTLADGLGGLRTGAGDLATGSRTLADGLGDLATGASGLSDGADKLAAGMHGTKQQPGLLDGSAALRQGVEGDGTAKNPGLVGGAEQLADGAEQYAKGVDAAYTGLRDGTKKQPGLVPTADRVADGAEQLSQGIAGDGTLTNPGMTNLADSMEKTACGAAQANPTDPTLQALCAQATGMTGYTDAVDTGLNGDGTQANPGLVAGTRGVADFAEKGLDTAFQGDGTAKNPGLIAPAQELADGARTSADAAPQLVDGVVALDEGLKKYATGVDDLADGASKLDDGASASASGADDLADGAQQLADGAGRSVTGADALADGIGQLADGARRSAEGTGQLADGADQLASGASQSSDGAGRLAAGGDELATGADGLASGSQQLADGSDKLAGGAGALADGTGQLSDGSSKLAQGTDDMASGLHDGADQVPSYDNEERARMAEMGAKPVTSFVERQNEASGAATATFPFVTALALWLGAFGAFLLLPAVSSRLLNRAIPMWQAVLRSLLPAIAIAVVQTVAVLAVITALGIEPVSPLSVGVICLAAGVMFAAFHQALLALLGDRVGRIASIVVMVLQVVALVGILPTETAPPLLQSASGVMPLSIVTQGLVHAALGGSLVSTSSTLGLILVWFLVSVAVTLVASRTARRVDLSPRAMDRLAPAGA